MSQAEKFHLACVMGDPISQSRSPMLHNFWMRQHGLQGLYLARQVPEHKLEAALRGLPLLGFSGCNLTIPLKERALDIVDEIDPVAEKIGAISCVTVREDGSLFGSNNDCFGFAENLLEAFPDWRADAGPVTVIGAGGAARAVIFALAEGGAREIRLTNRTQERAERLAAESGGPVSVVRWNERHDALDGAALVVNTTSQGMVKQSPLDLRLEALPKSGHVCDVVYNPGETPLIAAARRRGHRVVNGLGMLLHQGRPAWKGWFGIDPKVTPELRREIEATI